MPNSVPEAQKGRVCFVAHGASMSGAERILLELVLALKAQGVGCCVLLPCPGPLARELGTHGIPAHVVRYRHWVSGRCSLWRRAARAVWNLVMTIPTAVQIARWRCEVVCTNTVTVCVGSLAAWILHLPHVWFIHEFGREDHGLLFDLGDRISLHLMSRLSDLCVAISWAVHNKYEKHIPPHKIRVVYPSVVDSDPVLASATGFRQPRSSLRCATVGSVHRGKGQEDAIRAVARLVYSHRIEAKLLVIGPVSDQEYSQWLTRLTAELRLTEYVEFTGYVDSALPYIEGADVFIMCSRSEAFGRVTVEAMLLGRPVVGTRSGGTTELVEEGFNGLLYTPGDDEELADKLRWLYDHPDIAVAMGRHGRQWASGKFTAGRYARDVRAVLEEVTRQRGR